MSRPSVVPAIPAEAMAGGRPERDPQAVARSLCLRQLTMGPRSRAQLATVLARGGVAEDIAEQVLGRLTEVGLIDDAAFAEAWVRSRSGSRGLSRRAIGAELRTRGVPEEIAEEALGGRDDEADVSSARSLVERRLGASRGLPHEVRTRRLVAMLGRKGYDGATALRVVRAALAEEPPDASPGHSGQPA